jgi:small subunit ribosomal protein S6
MMASEREYELILMLDPEAPDERRNQIADEARRRIEDAGTLKHGDTWGTRKLAYEIRQRTEADYRFYRFLGGGGLLDDLDHNLKITDGVLRFRIFTVDPEAPMITPPEPQALGGRREGRRDGRGDRRGGHGSRRQPDADAAERAAPPEAEPAPAAETEPAAEAEPASEPAPAEGAAEQPEPVEEQA